jgi:hypothetical protein
MYDRIIMPRYEDEERDILPKPQIEQVIDHSKGENRIRTVLDQSITSLRSDSAEADNLSPYASSTKFLRELFEQKDSKREGIFGPPERLNNDEFDQVVQHIPDIAQGLGNTETFIATVNTISRTLDYISVEDSLDTLMRKREVIRELVPLLDSIPWADILDDDTTSNKGVQLIRSISGLGVDLKGKLRDGLNTAPVLQKLGTMMTEEEITGSNPEFYINYLMKSLHGDQQKKFIENLSENISDGTIKVYAYAEYLLPQFNEYYHARAGMQKFLEVYAQNKYGVNISPILASIAEYSQTPTSSHNERYIISSNIRRLFDVLDGLKDPSKITTLYEYYGIVHFGRYPLEALIQQAEREKPDLNKKRSVIISAHDDHNGAFNNFGLTKFMNESIESLDATHEPTIYEVGRIKDLLHVFQDLARDERPIDFLTFSAHGSKDSVRVGSRETLTGLIRTRDLFKLRTRFPQYSYLINEQTLIVLNSCLTGSFNTKEDENLAREASRTGARVLAAGDVSYGVNFYITNDELDITIEGAPNHIYQNGELLQKDR